MLPPRSNNPSTKNSYMNLDKKLKQPKGTVHSSLSNQANINALVTGSNGGAQSLLESYRAGTADQIRP